MEPAPDDGEPGRSGPGGPMRDALGPGMPAPAVALPGTGDFGVDNALKPLGDLAGLPVEEHPAVFEQVHRRLVEALSETEGHGVPPRPGDLPARPGR